MSFSDHKILTKLAAAWREQAKQNTTDDNPFGGHDYDDCANNLELFLNRDPQLFSGNYALNPEDKL